MKRCDTNSNSLYPVYFSKVKNLQKLVQDTMPTKYFSILVCADFKKIHTADISWVEEKLLEKGNLYFCAWGNDCERAHDIYDEIIAVTDVQDLIMTTWHDDESIDDALWYVLYNAHLHDKKDDDCSTIIVSVDNPVWEENLLNNLSDIVAFNERMISE